MFQFLHPFFYINLVIVCMQNVQVGVCAETCVEITGNSGVSSFLPPSHEFQGWNLGLSNKCLLYRLSHAYHCPFILLYGHSSRGVLSFITNVEKYS